MTRERLDGLYLLFLGCVFFLLSGLAIERASPAASIDFKLVYYSASCVLQHRDPYQETVLKQVYREAGEHATERWNDHPLITKFLYPPTLFLVTAPLALLNYELAHVLWLALTAAAFILAAVLIWRVGADYAPVAAGALAGLVLANSQILLILGNPTGIVVGLSVIAVWCLMSDRFTSAGVVCLALALIVKPQEGGPIWLYFILAGGVYRKRALQTLVVVVLLSIPTVVWITSVAPGWLHEFHTLLVAASVHGAMNDPGPTSTEAHGIGMVISLQTAFSLFRDDPRFYNAAAYAVCGPLFLLWLVGMLKIETTSESAWFAIPPLTCLSLLPVYHRIYDAEILLLLIPACIMLWAASRVAGRVALLLSMGAIVVSGAIPWALFLQVLSHMHLPSELNSMVQVLPVPLTLLATGVFYLWIYLRRMPGGLPLRD